RYVAANAATAVARARAPALRCVAAYRPIMGRALGSIMAVIMTAQAATYAHASAADGVMTICMPAMSSPLIGERTSTAQAQTVTAMSPAYGGRTERSRVAGITSQGGGGPGVVLLVEVIRAVERLHEIAVDRRLVAGGVGRAHARRQPLDAGPDVGAVEERDRVAVAAGVVDHAVGRGQEAVRRTAPHHGVA